MMAHDNEVKDNAKALIEQYNEMWEVICGFLTSKEYLSNYNPIFLQTNKHKKERDQVLCQLFEIRSLDIDVEFYEIIIHLMYKQILSEKFENLKKLQKVVMIQKRWKEFRKGPTRPPSQHSQSKSPALTRSPTHAY